MKYWSPCSRDCVYTCANYVGSSIRDSCFWQTVVKQHNTFCELCSRCGTHLSYMDNNIIVDTYSTLATCTLPDFALDQAKRGGPNMAKHFPCCSRQVFLLGQLALDVAAASHPRQLPIIRVVATRYPFSSLPPPKPPPPFKCSLRISDIPHQTHHGRSYTIFTMCVTGGSTYVCGIDKYR